MQDHPRTEFIAGAVFATIAAAVMWYVGFVLTIPVAVLIAWVLHVSGYTSFMVAAGILAVIPAIGGATFLSMIARRHRDMRSTAKCAACGWAIGCCLGEAFAWLLLWSSVISFSP